MEGSREDIRRERKVGVSPVSLTSPGQTGKKDPSDFTNKNKIVNLIHRLRSHSVHIVKYSSGHQDTYPSTPTSTFHV